MWESTLIFRKYFELFNYFWKTPSTRFLLFWELPFSPSFQAFLFVECFKRLKDQTIFSKQNPSLNQRSQKKKKGIGREGKAKQIALSKCPSKLCFYIPYHFICLVVFGRKGRNRMNSNITVRNQRENVALAPVTDNCPLYFLLFLHFFLFFLPLVPFSNIFSFFSLSLCIFIYRGSVRLESTMKSNNFGFGVVRNVK